MEFSLGFITKVWLIESSATGLNSDSRLLIPPQRLAGSAGIPWLKVPIF